MNDRQLPEKKKVQRHAWRFEDGTNVEMSWDMFQPGVGNAVLVESGAAFFACLPRQLHNPFTSD